VNEPIEDYLDGLYGQLRTDPRSARRMLDEAADHLHGAAAEFEEQGMTRVEAEREAVRRFGDSAPIVRADARRTFPTLVFDTGKAVTLLGAIGLVAIGVSGLLAGAMAALFGRQFVGGGLAHSVFGGPPASVAEDAGDAVSLRVLAGFVGLLVLAGLWAVRHARPQWMALRVLPAAYVDLVALVAFASAGILLFAASIVQIVQYGGHGTGFFLSGAVVALAGALVYGVRSVRSVLHRRA
jgi:hypothetical protein